MVQGVRRTRGRDRRQVSTAVTVVGVGMREGILLAMVLSLLQHVKRGYRPPTAVILRDEHRHWRMEAAGP
jgi:MFS superfamily sulfate permease-like transporter